MDNLPSNITNLGLKQLFNNVGNVVDTFVSRKSRRGVGGVSGFVRFKKEVEAKEAIKKHNKLVFRGKKILVQLSRFARDKTNYKGVHERSWGGPIKDNSMRGPLRSTRSYANVVPSINGSLSANQVRKNGVAENKGLGLGLSEKTLVEEWVKQLIQRDCVEEKLVVVVGDKEMVVHGVMLNPPREMGVKEVKVAAISRNRDTYQVERVEENVELRMNDEVIVRGQVLGNNVTNVRNNECERLENFVDSLIATIIDDCVNFDMGACGRDISVDLLFPEVTYRTSHMLGQSGVMNKVSTREAFGVNGLRETESRQNTVNLSVDTPWEKKGIAKPVQGNNGTEKSACVDNLYLEKTKANADEGEFDIVKMGNGNEKANDIHTHEASENVIENGSTGESLVGTTIGEEPSFSSINLIVDEELDKAKNLETKKGDKEMILVIRKSTRKRTPSFHVGPRVYVV